MHQKQSLLGTKMGVFFVVLTIVLIGLLVLTNWKEITSYIQNDKGDDISFTGTQSEFFVGKEIGLSGTLIRQGDLTKYTHTLVLPNGQLLGLKSTTLALDQYSGDVIVGGSIVDLAQGIYILDVQTVVPLFSNTLTQTGKEMIENSKLTGIVYVLDARIFIDTQAFPDLKVVVDQAAKKITLSTTGKTLTMSYFLCTKRIVDENCEELAKMFREAGSELVWTSPEGDEFREVPDTNSIFGSLQGKVGYYIDAPDRSFVVNVLNAVTFVGDGFLRAKFEETAPQVCRTGEHTLTTVTNITPIRGGDKEIEVYIDGKDPYDQSIVCKVVFDPTYALGGRLISISKTGENLIGNQNANVTSTDVSSSQAPMVDRKQKTGQTVDATMGFSLLTRDPSVQQVPTSTTQTYTHTGKDYTITFPSLNLRYNWVSLTGDKTLGFPGLSCYGKFHVIAYEKDQALRDFKLINEPKVIIYVCLDNQNLAQTLTSSFFVTRQEQKKRMFLVQPLDPSWYDFASQIVISEL